MPTSVHIPQPLLNAVDRKARALRVSRNRLIVDALKREIEHGTNWSSGFFERLADVDDDIAGAVREMVAAIASKRTAKRPPKL